MEVSSRRNTRIRALPPRHVRSADVTQPEVFPFPPSMSTTVDLTKDDAAQPVSVPTTTHISASQAAEIDVKLMSPEYGFTLEQLMELAGLSVAAATQRVFPVTPNTHQHILVLCGTGKQRRGRVSSGASLSALRVRIRVCLLPETQCTGADLRETGETARDFGGRTFLK